MSEKLFNFSLKLAFVQLIKICIQTFSALILGIFISCVWLVNDAWFKIILEEKIQTAISDMIKLPVACKINEINLISSKITCSDLLCIDKDWQFTCPNFVFKFSWISFFLKPKIEAELIFYGAKAFTKINKDYSLPIFSALKIIFNTPTVLPIFFKNYTLKECLLNIQDASQQTNITILFSIDTLIHDLGIKNIITISDGVINHKNKDVLQHIASNLIINLKDQNLDSSSFSCNFDIPLLKEFGNQLNVAGNYQNNNGNLYISNAQRDISVQIDNLKNDISLQVNSINASIKADFPIAILTKLMHSIDFFQNYIFSLQSHPVMSATSTTLSPSLKLGRTSKANSTLAKSGTEVDGLNNCSFLSKDEINKVSNKNFKFILGNKGTCQIKADVNYKDNIISYNGLLFVKDIINELIKFNKLDLTFSGINLDINGKVDAITSLGDFVGNWRYGKSHSATAKLESQHPTQIDLFKTYDHNLNIEVTNKHQINLTKNLKILENGLKSNFLIDKDLNVKLYYNTEIQQQNISYKLLGEINKKDNLLDINGLVNSSVIRNETNPSFITDDFSKTTTKYRNFFNKEFEYKYSSTLIFNERDFSLNIKTLKINDINNNLCNLNLDNKTKSLKGQINDILIKDLITDYIDYEIKNSGKINLCITTPTLLNKKLFSDILFEVEDANIRLPYIYNNINSITGRINLDIDNNRLFINNLNVKLLKGQINTSQATIAYDLSNYGIDYIHIPILISDCLVSWKRDFFGILTGRLSIIFNFPNINIGKNYRIKNNSEISKIEGQIILANSFLHNNLISEKAKKGVLKNTLNSLNKSKEDMQLNIELLTYEPIKVKNKFLDTSASIRAIAKGTILNPEISGSIDLKEGFFAFPYKPLYIQSGKIFLNNNDPTVELIAKNTIDKHIITLHVTGAISNAQIYLESMPNLSDEQILTLLFAGTKDGSLSTLMPAVIVTALQDLLFNSQIVDAKNIGQIQSLKNLLEPLKDIKLIPSISSGQGKGVQASLGISFKDKLKAFIQKNINMSEETQVKVEYALSDDINICGVKDDQGNVSGEVEMRWKF